MVKGMNIDPSATKM